MSDLKHDVIAERWAMLIKERVESGMTVREWCHDICNYWNFPDTEERIKLCKPLTAMLSSRYCIKRYEI